VVVTGWVLDIVAGMLAGRGIEKVEATKPSGTEVGEVKAASVATESRR
jgi:hypothetical protein